MPESLPLAPLNSKPEGDRVPKSSASNQNSQGKTKTDPIQPPLTQGESRVNPSPVPKAEANSQSTKSNLLGVVKGALNKNQPTSPAATPVVPQVLTPEPLSPTPPTPPASPNQPPATPVQPSAESKEIVPKTGNLFTRLFKGSKVEDKKGSIIDTIVDTKEAEKIKEKEAKRVAKDAKRANKKPKDWQFWFKASRLFFHFNLLFVVVGTVFLYIQIVDVNNSVFGWFNGPQNYAMRLDQFRTQLTDLERQEAELKGEVVRYQEGYNDPNEALLNQIVDSRLSWEEVKEQLDGAAERLYPLNDFFGYLEYTNYNIDFESKQVSFTATLRDPSGNNFTALADFENILQFYPSDPDENDGLKPYFTDVQEITSYSERYDSNTDTYETVFSMTMKINDTSGGLLESLTQ